MRCLRIYVGSDGESHFDHVEIPLVEQLIMQGRASFALSPDYEATNVCFARIPASRKEIGFHTVPERLLTVRLDGSVEYETSDGETRRVGPGEFVMIEDTHGKGHKSRHSGAAQLVIWISMPQGLEPRVQP